LKQQVTPSWFERYGQRMDNTRLPDETEDREALAWLIGQDGYYLLNRIEAAPDSLAYLCQLPAVQTLRQIWLQHYCWIEGKLRWRLRHEHGLPPAAIAILSPYDPEVRYGEKRGKDWVDYKVHLTETCEEEQVHLITHVETTTAAVPDNHMLDLIHEALQHKDLLPSQHLVDAGYPDGENLLTSQDNYQVDLVARVRPDNGWQAREATGYDASQFQINWETLRATCPQGQQSYPGKAGVDPSHRPIVRLIFPPSICRACTVKLQYTRGKSRYLNLLPHRHHETLQAARQRQSTDDFKETFRRRAGIEGTISQAVYALTMRRSRYVGVAKTHLHHFATAAAINLMRVIHWLNGVPLAGTQQSQFARLAPASF
jgi:transposase